MYNNCYSLARVWAACAQGRRKLFLVGGGGGAEIEVWSSESSAAGARLYRGIFLV